MKKYLYLTRPDWTTAWVLGGDVPISLASNYLSPERKGIYTPDENLTHNSPVDLLSLKPFIGFGPNPDVRGLTIKGCSFNGVAIPDIVNASIYLEDGLILSFCDAFDIDIAKRLDKKACVEIKNIDRLRSFLNWKLGKTAKFGSCLYTTDHQRNHFLKSQHDSWQQEYRFFWRINQSRSVTLPPGMAKVVWVEDPKVMGAV
ncbi:MAG: hypothetical protein V7756_09495 [Halopseudomonas sp.]|uniref:hypothetical protein n=1 Tax=Halopseudomonas sp. TaxID=2901191 RepID=UPI00300205D9